MHVNIIKCYCTILLYIGLNIFVHCAPNKHTWPSKLKDYDIWGTNTKSNNAQQTLSLSSSSSTLSGIDIINNNNNNLVQDYRNKTSLRDGKGKSIFL